MPGGPNDPLMHDPVTGTQYYASEASNSYAYWQAIANDPQHQADIKASQEEYAAQLERGVPPQAAADIAVSKHNPDSVFQRITPDHVLAQSTPVTTTSSAPPKGVFHLDKLYRFFMTHPLDQYGNRFETGATYSSCSRTNPAGCQGKCCPDETSMWVFAQKEGSTLIQVSSADEAYSIMEGKQTIDPAKIYTGGPLSSWQDYVVPAAVAYIAWKMLF